jgi:leader peptidase (prepilin peptidase)/N-methyltransferase
MTVDAVFAWLIAPFVGSFLGLVVDRLPVGQPVLLGRSVCDGCGRPLGVRDLVPIVSFLVQRGRARCCGARLPPFYPMIEIAALVVAVWASLVVDGWLLWVTCGLGWTLLVLAWIDLRHFWLPDVLTLPLIPAGLAITYAIGLDRLVGHAIAAALGFGALALIAWGYQHVRGREGLGLGDAKLLAGAGAWLGPAALPSVVLLGAVAGLAAALAMGRRGAKLRPETAIAFGPWLALAFWVVWLHGPVVIG